MTDKELLEKAAKAAEYVVTWHHANQSWMILVEKVERKWNPLTDDGDALRLAVKLGMRVYIYNGGGDDYTCVATDELSFAQETIKVMHDGDSASATRRAITRAAAAMAP